MLDFYGYAEIVNNIRILNIAKINLNDSFLIDYKKVLNGIIFNSINSINGSKYVLNGNCLKIIVDTIKCEDDTNDKLIIPINCLLKFDMIVLSCKLAIEIDGVLNIKLYLQEYLFDDNWFKH